MEQISMFEAENAKEREKEILEIEKLREEIRYHNKLYYENDEPEISDFEYDKLTQRLKALEKKYPETVNKYSPTQIVGGNNKKGFSEVVHDVPMQSLQDVFSLEDVEEFIDKVENELGRNLEFCVETKIDGLSVSLEYENGKLTCGSTRGNGNVGEDVTENILCIKSIPQFLKTNETIEVRGEVFLPREEFYRLNEELEKDGKKLLSNPRNAAAGTLRQLDSKLVKHRNLDIFIFNVQKCKTQKFIKHSESLDFCKNEGLHTLDISTVCKNKEEVIKEIKRIGDLRESLAYDIDGAVVKINELSIRDVLGTTVKVPKWAIAYKYPPEQKETTVEDIIVQVGRTGKLTPMAKLTPVRVAGSIISSVTLHNFDYIEEKDVRVGDVCVIQKAGDVIPELDHIVIEKRNKNLEKYVRPEICPVCHEKVYKDDDTVDVRCTNSECPALLYRSIVHFVSRDCMDISGLGESIVEKLIDSKKIEDVADIYYLKYEDIYGLDTFKEKSTKNLLDAIEKTKSNSLDKLLFGLGIRNVGKKAAQVLSEKFEDIYELANADIDTLKNLDDFGSIMAESVYYFFKKPKTMEIISKLEKVGVNLKGNKKETLSNILEGKIVAVTGSFDNYSRDEIVKMIEENSGKASSSVSKKTSFLIAGENAGSKLKKAEELSVEVIDIAKFEEMINLK